MTPQELAESYDGKIVMRRAHATSIDFFILLVVVGGVAALGKFETLPVQLTVIFGVSAVYYLAMETFFGKTVGKMMVGLVVVGASGAKPTFGETFLRTAVRAFEVNPFLLGCLPAALTASFSKSHRRLGDMLAGTYVIRKRDLSSISEASFLGSSLGAV